MPSNDGPGSRRPSGGGGGGSGRPPAKGSGGRSSAGGGSRGDGGAKRGADGRGRSSSKPGTAPGGGGAKGRRPDSAGRGGAGGARSGDGAPRGSGPRAAGPKSWGSLGRKGAGRLSDPKVDPRNAVGGSGRDDRPDPGHAPVRWERVDPVRKEAAGAVARGKRPAPVASEDLAPKERRGRARRDPGAGTAGAQSKDELVRALGAARGARANDRLRDAAHAFERERFEESRSLLRPIAEAAPQATSVRELLGLTYYRLGRWNDAVRELEAFRQQSGSTEQHPVLADCYRALGRRREVEDLWDELRESSPSADLVAEGRIVMAGSLADEGKLTPAIALLEKAQRSVKRPGVHHLRQAYVLGDLYERAGDVARARELFRWVSGHEPDFVDAAERAAALT